MKSETRTELHSGNILIRKIRMEDIELLFQAVKESLPELSLWMNWATKSYSRSDCEEFIKYSIDSWDNENEYNFFIINKETRKLVGGCGLNQFDKPNKKVNLGYWVRSSEIGKGYATCGALLTSWFAFEDLKMNRVEILASVENYGSLKVARRTGAHKEGVLKKRIIVKNRTHDAVLYGLTNSDIKEIKLRLNRF